MKNNTASKLKSILGERSLLFYILILLGVLKSILMVGMAISIKTLVNAYEYNLGESAVLNSAIILIAVVVLSFIVGILDKLVSSKYTVIIEEKLKTSVFKSFLSGSYSDIISNSSGDLISKLSVDALRVSNVYANLTPSLISTVTHLLGIIVALFILEPTFTLIVLVLGVIAIIATLFLRKILVKYYKSARSKEATVSSYVSEVSKNSLVIKALNVESNVSNIYDSKVLGYKNFKLKHAYLGAVITSVTAFTFTLFYAISVIMGVNGMLNGSAGINFGVIIAVLQLITQIKTPINNIASYFTVYNEMLISADRLLSIAYGKCDFNQEYTSGFEGLTIKDLNYSYDDKPVLKNLNLTVNKGDKILINGASGEGKSTLLKIITGLYSNFNGEVYLTVNGKKITPNNIKGVYSYVPQDNMLFSGTIKENITFNNIYDFDKIKEVLSICSVDFISHNEVGLMTYIGENGLNISTGQGQRIAIARGLIKGTPVIILDEATSSLDDKTEEEILSKLSKIENLTIIFISHKTCFNKYANKVYNLKGGDLFTTFDNSKNENA